MPDPMGAVGLLGSVSLESLAPGDECSACAAGVEHCHGVELDHKDGTVSCSLDSECLGSDVLHVRGASCFLVGPCGHCG
jgi:hypothetical protein